MNNVTAQQSNPSMETEYPGEVNVNINKEEMQEFQRFITEIKGMDLIFYQALCGWRSKKGINSDTYLDVGYIKDYSKFFDVDKKMKYCNEEFASTLSNSIYGLISHITTTGNLTEREIYDLWNGHMDSINYDIITNYYTGNTGEIKIECADRITSFCCEFSAYTKKARSGSTLNAFKETIVSIFTNRANQPQPQKNIKDIILNRR